VRANAFAVTLLLPSEVAYRAWDKAGAPIAWTGLEELLNQLTARYGLPRIAAARQIVHGSPPERGTPLYQVFSREIEGYRT
jgi:Zn-dependent peptidase ImmA (M78 family)